MLFDIILLRKIAMKRLPLTTKQLKVLRYISQYYNNFGYPPTVREIQAYMQLRSTSSAESHLRALLNKGYLKKGKKGETRNIDISSEAVVFLNTQLSLL